MSFYFRESVSVGPFRFNLSGSGISVSAGIKGLRVGWSPRGNYVSIGRNGLYYKKTFKTSRQRTVIQTQPQFEPLNDNPSPSEIEQGNVLAMVPSTYGDIIQQVNDKKAKWSLWPFFLITGLFLAMLYNDAKPIILAAILAVTLILTCGAAYIDKVRKKVVILYDLEDDSMEIFRNFCEQFEQLGSCAKKWVIATRNYTSDWKRNAGAGQLVMRKNAFFSYKQPPIVQSNISVPCFSGGKQSVYFLPDLVLIMEGGKIGGITYNDFIVNWQTTIFVETESVPQDANVVGQTWRFVNKKGGPDKRFSNNRQIPKVQYTDMNLIGSSGFRKIILLSNVGNQQGFDGALNDLKNIAVATRKPAKHNLSIQA